MKVRLFIIRLDSDKLTNDENHLNGFLETVDFVKSDVHFVESKVNYWSVLVHYKENLKTDRGPSERNEIIEQGLNPPQKQLYSTLKNWRFEKSQKLKLPTYAICHNSELLNAIIRGAKTPTDLRSIKGFGEFKVEKYGDEILSILNAK